MEAWRREERFLRAAGRRFRRSERGRKSRPSPFGMTDEKGAAGTENYGVMAMTRRGLPEPPTILRGAAQRQRQVHHTRAAGLELSDQMVQQFRSKERLVGRESSSRCSPAH